MRSEVRVITEGVDAIPAVEELWLALFDHHVSFGAAGLATIERHHSWPLREAHYRRLFATGPHASLTLALEGDRPVGYAMSYGTTAAETPAILLETLSVSPHARGLGVGTMLMDAVDEDTRAAGINQGLIDVMHGNTRAKSLYVRRGYLPFAENWMRSRPPRDQPTTGNSSPEKLTRAASRQNSAALKATARSLGLHYLEDHGPDDTWVSSDVIVTLRPFTDDVGTGNRVGADIDAGDFATLLHEIEAAGIWTICCVVPASSPSRLPRALLRDQGFLMTTERLVHDFLDSGTTRAESGLR